jgi:hypothetical protein
LLLLALPGLIYRLGWNSFLSLAYLQTPVYMLHQVEEHARDRFRTFLNQEIYNGVEALTPVAVLWINIPGVWGITFVSLCMAVFVAAGWGFIGAYLIAVNAIVHLVWWGGMRKYNPGLWTAILLFVPLSILTFWKSAGIQATWLNHVVGLAVAIGIHAAIVIQTGRRARHLRALHSDEL